MITLIRIEADEYIDQYGIHHECFNIVEKVDVEATGEHESYQYYSETIEDPLYQEVTGVNKRQWRCCVATDFGCPASWHRRNSDGERVADEAWVRNRDGAVYQYGLKPVLELKRTL